MIKHVILYILARAVQAIVTALTCNIELAKRFPKTSSRRGNTNAKFYIGISLDG